jgi:hypothetical protein
MSFLRRLLGGAPGDERETTAHADADADAAEPSDAPGLEAEERARELELLRSEQARFDELRQRQLRYAGRAWTPPAQGGERRADDAGGGEGG